MLSSPSSPNPMVKWGALLVIALMLLSGVAVYFGSLSSSNTNGNDPNNPPDSSENLVASEVEGTIVQVFPSAIVGGQTRESDKTAIDEALQTVPGVTGVTSQFTQLNAQDSILTYVANITLQEDTDRVLFVNAVNQLDLFDVPEVYFQSSVQVPTSLTAANAQNVESSVTLPSNLIQGIVFPGDMAGDRVVGTVYLSMQNSQVANAYLVESQNLSASPQPITLTQSHPLAELEKNISMVGDVPYFPGFSSESLQDDLSQLPGIVGVAPPIIPSFTRTLVVNYADANTITADLNAFVVSHPDWFSSFTPTFSGFNVELNQISVLQARSELQDAIAVITSSQPNLSFVDPINQFLVDANTSSLDVTTSSIAVKNYFADQNANASVDIFQNGWVDINSLYAPDLNQLFSVPNNRLRVSVRPGHAMGDSVSIQISAVAVRGELVYVTGVETEEALTFSLGGNQV